MAHTYAAQDISHLTGAAVAFGQIVKFSGVDAQNAGLAVPCATAGEQAVGVAASVATAAGETLMITVGGVCKALFGATVAPGVRFTTNASGRVIAAGAGQAVLGTVVLGAGNGEIGSVLFDKDGTVPSA